MKNNKKITGITLIALVITIVVLLILAGVTIVTLTGDNSLLIKTQQAKEENLKADGREIIEVEVSASYDNHGNIDLNQLNKNLEKISGLTYNDRVINVDKSDTENYNEIKELTATVKLNGYKYKITRNGKVKIKSPENIEASDIKGKETNYYGKYVINYNSPNDEGIANAEGQLGKWRIFLADDTNIYLIASNYISRYYTKEKDGIGLNYNTSIKDTKQAYNLWLSSIRSKYYASSTKTDIPELLSKFSSETVSKYHRWMNIEENQIKNVNNVKSTAAMIDVDDMWDGYKNSKYADYALGGATIEMFCDSYNQTHNGVKLTSNLHKCGYMIQKDNLADASRVGGLKTNSDLDEMYFTSGLSEFYWLASPAGGDGDYYNALEAVNSGGTIGGYDHAWQTQFALRPVVCLNAEVYLKPSQTNGVTTYTIEIN